jgi:hypothetical protein
MKCFTDDELWPAAAVRIRDEAELRRAAEALVRRAADIGSVLTIEQRPLTPLAMGHYETVVSVRAAREAA